jgi:hypothetical protein
MTKVVHAFKHSGGLRQRFFESCLPVQVGGQSTAVIIPEPKRLHSELDKIARGLHYYHFKQKWLAPTIWILSPSRLRSTESLDEALSRICTEAQEQMQNEPCYGDNPDIFYFQAREDRTSRLTMIKMAFYGGFEVFALNASSI